MNESANTRPTTHTTVGFESPDGHRLEGDVAIPGSVRAGAVVCHPHPQYGGTRHDAVVGAVYDALPTVGVAALRFDFRAEFADGIGERLDASAALDELASAVGPVATDMPLVVVGYSFGAAVALGLDDDRVAAIVAIAPPLSMMPIASAPTVPTLVLTPAHDQISPPDTVAPTIHAWRSDSATPIDFEVIEMADHFLAGRTAAVAERAATWLDDRLSGRSQLPFLP